MQHRAKLQKPFSLILIRSRLGLVIAIPLVFPHSMKFPLFL
jgi:hypothetical protein